MQCLVFFLPFLSWVKVAAVVLARVTRSVVTQDAGVALSTNVVVWTGVLVVVTCVIGHDVRAVDVSTSVRRHRSRLVLVALVLDGIPNVTQPTTNLSLHIT